jgi:galactosamine-6-phosphate isomerase
LLILILNSSTLKKCSILLALIFFDRVINEIQKNECKMKIFVADTYSKMSNQAADDVIEIMRSREQPLICTASGDSPAGLYKEIVERAGKAQVNVTKWFFLGLDEWVGMNGNDEGSCRYHLNQQLFHPLHTADERICFFDGRASDLQAECEHTEEFIHEHGGIDVAILGVGMNGHVGMNEPGTSINFHSHVTHLDPTTQQVGQKYFKKEQKLTRGITLGMATLMEARNIILLASGKHKAEIIQKIVEGEISEKLPATLLRNHSALKIYLDADAASKMINS